MTLDLYTAAMLVSVGVLIGMLLMQATDWWYERRSNP